MRKKVVVSVYREYLINDVEQRITESRLVGWLVGWGSTRYRLRTD